jgi:SET domain-containing protein
MSNKPLSWFKEAKKTKKENSLIIKEESQIEEEKTPPKFDPNTLCNLFAPSYLYLKFTGKKGFGVFTKKEIKKGEIIETCYSIILKWRQRYHHDPSILQYCYWHSCPCKECKEHGPLGLVALGYGSIYNTAESENERNAFHDVNAHTSSVTFTAERDIKIGEEILTWWGHDYYRAWCESNK